VEFTNEFELEPDAAHVWPLLVDIEDTATCMPGATVTRGAVDGAYDVKLRVALGPIKLTYGGTLDVVDLDEAGRTMVLNAKVKEGQGGGRAEATVRTALSDSASGGTVVTVTSDVQVTGRAAQMGRSVIEDVSRRMTNDFATCLAGRFAGRESGAGTDAKPGDAPVAVPMTPGPEQRPISGFWLLMGVVRDRLTRLFRRKGGAT
jgi:carbon monoxide dehydrogenase subunit G